MSNLKWITIAALIALPIAPRAVAAHDAAAEPAPQTDDGPYGVAAGTWEAGLHWGLVFADDEHELFDAVSASYQQLEPVTPELGLRGGYYPLSVLGLELEAGLLPSQTRTSGDGVNLWSVRAHAVVLAPTGATAPFLVIGGGALGVSSDDAVLGSEADAAFHVGLGLRAFVTRDLALRLDVRDTFTSGRGDATAQHWEALLGLSLVVARPEAPTAPPIDGDGDAVADEDDRCPTEAGDSANGCLLDVDGDGIADRDDKCAAAAETKNGYEDQDGCPDALPQPAAPPQAQPAPAQPAPAQAQPAPAQPAPARLTPAPPQPQPAPQPAPNLPKPVPAPQP